MLSTTSRSDLRIRRALLDVGGRHCGGSRKVDVYVGSVAKVEGGSVAEVEK